MVTPRKLPYGDTSSDSIQYFLEVVIPRDITPQDIIFDSLDVPRYKGTPSYRPKQRGSWGGRLVVGCGGRCPPSTPNSLEGGPAAARSFVAYAANT